MDSSNATKIFISEEQHIIDSYQLGAAIFASDYRPTFILGVWRGGSTVALAVQECLAYLGVATNHITVRTSYEGRDQYERSGASHRSLSVISAVREIASRLKAPLIGEQCELRRPSSNRAIMLAGTALSILRFFPAYGHSEHINRTG